MLTFGVILFLLSLRCKNFLQIAIVVISIAFNNAHCSGITRLIMADPVSLDPHFLDTWWGTYPIMDIFEGLFTYDVNGKVIPGLAKSYKIARDGKSVEFKLDQNSFWSDGSNVTAHDFEFAFKRGVKPSTGARNIDMLMNIYNADRIIKGELDAEKLGVHAIDNYTLLVKFNKVQTNIPNIFAHYSMFPLPKHIVSEFGNKWMQKKPISNGAFVLNQWLAKDYIKLTKNPFCNTGPDSVKYKIVHDKNQGYLMYQSNQADIAVVSSFLKPSQLKDSNQSKSLNSVSYLLNLHRIPDIKIRQAIALAIDNKKVLQDLWYSSIDGFSRQPYYKACIKVNDACIDSIGNRLDLAKDLMEKAGYSKDKHLQLTLRHIKSYDVNTMAIATQSMLREIYIDLNLIQQDRASHYYNITRGDFDMAYFSWFGDFADPENFLNIFSSDSMYNYSRFQDPEFSRLLDKSHCLNCDRIGILQSAEQLLLNKVALIPLVSSLNAYLIKSNISGFVANQYDVNLSKYIVKN